MTFNCQRRGPKQDPPGRLFGDFRIHKLEKIVGGGEGKKKYPAGHCKVCAAHKQSETTRRFKYDRDRFVCKQAALRSSCATLRE